MFEPTLVSNSTYLTKKARPGKNEQLFRKNDSSVASDDFKEFYISFGLYFSSECTRPFFDFFVTFF